MQKTALRLGMYVGWILTLSTLAAGSMNELTNPGAETGDLSGWVDPLGNGFAVNNTIPVTGSFCFTGGISGPVGSYAHELRQDVDVSHLAAGIDAGLFASEFAGWARSNAAGGFTDAARIVIEFQDAGGSVLSAFDSGTVFPVTHGTPWRTSALSPQRRERCVCACSPRGRSAHRRTPTSTLSACRSWAPRAATAPRACRRVGATLCSPPWVRPAPARFRAST